MKTENHRKARVPTKAQHQAAVARVRRWIEEYDIPEHTVRELLKAAARHPVVIRATDRMGRPTH